LDIARGSINIKQVKYQNRARKTICLVRLELEGPPHINPDGEEVPCPHIHLYREGAGLKWAYTIDKNLFTNVENLDTTLNDFYEYCNITRKPIVELDLFT